MTELAIDFLTPKAKPQDIRATGYTAVLRYLRNLTPAEADGYLAAGLKVGTIFETAAAESLGGSAAGVADGQAAADMMRQLAQPAGTLHVVNLADFAPAPAQLGAIAAYWRAYIAQLDPWAVIPYGTAWTLEQLGLYGWQNAMDDNGVRGDIVSQRAIIYQRIRPTLPQIPGTQPGDYDEDISFLTGPGGPQWWQHVQAPTPPIAPAQGSTPWWQAWGRRFRWAPT